MKERRKEGRKEGKKEGRAGEGLRRASRSSCAVFALFHHDNAFGRIARGGDGACARGGASV